MGDAGPSLPAVVDIDNSILEPREVNVLVTGFGPFKTFTENPSHLITTQLPTVLLPSSSATPSPFPPSNPTKPHHSSPPPTIIKLHIHPSPLRVSYPFICATLPTLLSSSTPYDFILHLGMAAGRRHYALESLAHRDGYTIKDIDGVDGLAVGSRRWANEGCPPILEVGWDGGDVMARWREELRRDSTATATATTAGQGAGMGTGQQRLGMMTAAAATAAVIPDVRLSKDPGRFVCDFIFYESLSLRWMEARQPPAEQASTETAVHSTDSPAQSPFSPPPTTTTTTPSPAPTAATATSKAGKVAFLHVPGDTSPEAITRGVRVTEAAIRALVTSWDEGWRRSSGGQTVGRSAWVGV